MSASKPSMPESLSPQGIMEMATAFMRSRVLLTAYELDLFTVLGDGTKSSGEVAGALGTDERATDRLMNALCRMGLLEKREGRFSNTHLASRILVKGKPDFMAGLMHMAHLWETWSTLTEAVRQGRSVVERAANVNERDSDWLRAFIVAMNWRARQHAPGVVSLLDLSDVSRVLDVGGGSGAYAMAFVRAKPDIAAVVFDLPNVIPLTQEYIMDEDRTGPPFAALFALNMLVGTEAGDTYTESEVRQWMEQEGLRHVVRKDTPFGTTLIIGKNGGGEGTRETASRR